MFTKGQRLKIMMLDDASDHPRIQSADIVGSYVETNSGWLVIELQPDHVRNVVGRQFLAINQTHIKFVGYEA